MTKIFVFLSLVCMAVAVYHAYYKKSDDLIGWWGIGAIIFEVLALIF